MSEKTPGIGATFTDAWLVEGVRTPFVDYNGALATVQASTNYNPQFGFHVQVSGTSGATASVWEMPEGVEGITDIWTVPGEAHLVHDRQRDGEPRPGFPEFHRLQLEDFVQAIQEGRPPAISGAEAKKALEIILAISR